MKILFKMSDSGLEQTVEGNGADVLQRLNAIQSLFDDNEVEVVSVEMDPEEQKTAFDFILSCYNED